MRVLLLGGGGREHAIAWKLSHSPLLSDMLIAPGNAGTASLGENVPVNAADIRAIVSVAERRSVDFVVVGPEIPLTLGIVDELENAGIPAFGPTRDAARIESSKAFAHEVMDGCGVPSAASRVFTSLQAARDHIETMEPPMVVKADGLAAGKGAIIASSRFEAYQALEDMLVKRIFGEAGDRVVIEEFLSGQEVSLLAFTDGQHVVPMVPSCDYKRVGNGNQGPNTGGMGCYSPPGFFSGEQLALATRLVLEPVVLAMASQGHIYKGVLYAGLMVDGDVVRVLEFNARFGDPETQVILPRLESDLLAVMLACHNGTLSAGHLRWTPGCSVGVVLASRGYPGPYEQGFSISGLESIGTDAVIFHAGTNLDDEGRVLTAGGRVLNVVATGGTMAEARERAYLGVSKIYFDGMIYRTDIALREVS